MRITSVLLFADISTQGRNTDGFLYVSDNAVDRLSVAPINCCLLAHFCYASGQLPDLPPILANPDAVLTKRRDVRMASSNA